MDANKSTNNTNIAQLVYPELSYTLTGILFEIHNKLGTKYQEKHYQRAIEIKLQETSIPFKREVYIPVQFEHMPLGRFFADFIIDDKIILEVKKVWRIGASDVKQVLRYLEATQLKLAIIVNFQHMRLESKRVLL